MAAWHLTPASPIDIEALLALEIRCFTWPWGRLSFDGEFAAPGSESWVASGATSHMAEEIVGYLFYRFIAEEVHIFRMAVSPEWRRQGIGACMLSKCLEKGSLRGVEAAILEVRPSNTHALQLYKKFGFHRIATRRGYYSDSGEDAYILKLDMKEDQL
jgi:ribosomal-protein-alanine N-acetyltransferase